MKRTKTISTTRRAAMTLLVMMLTTMTAWAQSGNWSDFKAAAFSTINESAKTISITSEAELALLAYNTCNGTDYSGYTITLTKDLSMSAHYWDKSIGTELSYYSGNNSFRGTFNGDNKTISGIYISSGSYKGLFGFVGMNEKPGTIQNVTLASSTITGDDNVGGIVGCLLYGTVSNCHVLSSVSILASGDGSNNHGGIVGQTYPNKKVSSATIENCTSAASVTDNGKSGCSDFGGIVGYNYYYSDTNFSKVTGCFYYGTAVSASSDAGAIVGLNYKADGTGISNCYYNYPSTISGIGYDNKDIGTTRVYTVTCTTSGLSTTGTATYTHNGTHYFAAGATVTVTLGAADKAITSLSAASGTISNVVIANDKHSATFTVGSSDVTDVTVSATLKALGGTTEDGLTWSLGGTNYTELTISGTGTMQNFEYSTDGIWKTKAPWGTDITKVTIGDGVTSIGNYAFIGCENLASITIGSGVTSIGIGAVNHCDQMTTVTLPASVTTIAYAAFENCQKLETIYINHDGEVSLTGSHDNAFNAPLLQYIAFPSPAGALANTKESGNWARYKDNIRARFGNQLFTATNEGGTAAYAITNESDLRNLSAAVNAGNDGNGKTFRQTLDITMTGGNFTPIGNFDYDNLWFSGTYNGGGYTISGLTVSGEYLYASLFGYINNGNVSYVNVLNPSISSSSKSSHEGAIVAFLSFGSVSNCYFYGGNQDDAIGYWITWEETAITNVGRAYAVNIVSSGVEATGNGFTHGTDRYLSGTVTLSGGTPHANAGWVDTYTVNGTAIEGNTFSLTADATVAYSSTPDGTHFAETADNEYTIYDATGWGVFCDLLAENDQGYFTGKTVVLDKDIAVTRMAGSTNHEFSGIFDGQKHTLTVAITGTVQGTAPFCEIKGATIRNLAVTGSVAGMRHSAGLVGFARGDNSVTNIIENCLVNTSVSITGDNNGYLGGIVGHGFTSALTIRGCAFTGSLTSTSNYTGGLQGWSDGNILTLQNDLFAPTSVSAANAGFHPVAFHNNNSTTTATVSNVYYTEAPTCTQATRIATANAAEQPKQARSVTAGENVTIEATALTGTETEYTVSGITAYSGGGLALDDGNETTLYYGSGDQVSLTLGNIPPEGYGFDGYTVRPDGATLTGSANPYTLTMPNADVTIGATFTLLPISVSYIDENGEKQTVDAIDLSKLDWEKIPAGVYSFSSNSVAIPNFDTTGDVTIIIPDDINIGCDHISGDNNVTFYGQEKGNGRLDVTVDIAGNVTVYGGNVSTGGYVNGEVTFNGGNVSIGGGVNGEVTFNGGNVSIGGGVNSNVILSWIKPSDRFYAATFFSSVEIAYGKAFYDEDGNIYSCNSGFISSSISGKTLRPAVILADDASNATAISDAATVCTGGKTIAVQLSGRTLSKSGEWNTLCLPFDVDDFSGTPLEGATVKELNATTSNLDNGTLTLNFTDADVIEAGKPYIVRWGTPEDNPGGTIVDPVFTDVTVSSTTPTAVNFTGGSFVGQYSPFSIGDTSIGTFDGDINEIIMLGTGNKLGYSKSARTLRSFRCHFYVPAEGSEPGARAFVLDFGEETTAVFDLKNKEEITNNEWYSLDGRKLDAKPTKKGLYIHNGNKVVIK